MSMPRSLTASLILSTALVLGACKGKDEAAVAVGDSGPAKALKTAKVSKSDVDGLFDIKSRKVPDAEADKALAQMGLDSSDKNGLSWEDRKGDKGSYTFNNLTVADDDGTVTIETMKLSGVRMEGEDATFDLMTATGLNAKSSEGTIRVAELMLADPSPALAAGIGEAINEMSDVKDLDDINIDLDDDEDLHFGALSLKTIDIEGDEVNGTLDSLAWGEDTDTGEGLFRLNDLRLKAKGSKRKDMPVDIKLGGINASGINVDYYRQMAGQKSRLGKKNPLGQVINNTGAFAKTFDTASFSDLDISVDGLHIQSDGGQGKSTERGGVITTKQVMQPLVIEFASEPTSRDMLKFKESLSSFGYDKLVITSSQESELNAKTDTMSVRDSYIDVKDAFRLSFDYQAGGVNAVTQAMLTAQQNDEDMSDREIEALTDNLSLKSFNLAFNDKSILERGFAFAAEKQGSSPKVLRMQAKSMLMMMGLGVKNEAQGAMVSELSSAVGDFIDNGGTLRIGLAPTEPLTVKQLKRLDTGDMGVDALGFSARTD